MQAQCFSTTLATDINQSCVSQQVGFAEEGYYIPFKDATLTSSEPFIVSAFTSTTRARKIKIFSNNPFKDSKTEGKKDDFIMMYDSTLPIFIPGDSPAISKQVGELANTKGIVILKKLGYSATDKNKYVIIGANRGLSVTTANHANDTLANFGWKVELKETEALTGVNFLWNTNEATTDAIITALLAV